MSKAIPNASKRLMRKLKKLEQHKKNVLIDRRAAALKAHGKQPKYNLNIVTCFLHTLRILLNCFAGSDDDVAAAEIKVDKKRFSQDRDSKEFPAKSKLLILLHVNKTGLLLLLFLQRKSKSQQLHKSTSTVKTTTR